MQADTIKLWFTYFTALVIIIGGGVFLFLTRSEPDVASLQLVISGFMGGAITFVFNRESATQASRASESSMRVGVDSQNPPA